MQDTSSIPASVLEPLRTTQLWRKTQFGNIVRFTKKPRDLHYTDYQTIPFVPMEVIPIGSVLFDQFDLRNSDDITSGTYFEPGDILLAKITPSFENGKQGIIQKLPTQFGIATTEVIPFNEIDEVSDKSFLFYFLLKNSIRSELTSKMEGSTGRQRLSVSALSNIEMALPPLPEQRTIAYILQTVQTAIQARRKEIELERERKAALMQHLFTHGTRGETTKMTEIGEMPESWSLVQLRDVTQGIPQNGAFIKQPQIGRGNFYVNVYDIYQGTILDFTKIERLECDKSILHKYSLKKNDLLFVRSSLKREGVGQCCLIVNMPEEAIFDCHLIKVSPDLGKINPLYMTYYFLSEKGRNDLIMRSKTTTMTTINQKNLIETVFPLSSLTEQHEIATILQACDSKIEALEKEIALQEELFRALLEELMSGRLAALPLVEEPEKG